MREKGNHTPTEAKLHLSERINTALASGFGVDSLLALVVRETAAIVGVERVSVMLLDPSTGELYFRAAVGFDESTLRTIRFPITEGKAGQAVQTGQPVVVNDAALDSGAGHEILFKEKIRGFAHVPLKVRGSVIGILSVNELPASGAFTTEDVELLSALADQTALGLEIARLREREKETNQELNALNQAKSDFLATASHEFRSPLGNISAFAQLLLSGSPGPITEKQRDYLGRICKQTDFLVRVVENVLDLRRIEHGRMQFSISPRDCALCLREAVNSFAAAAHTKSVTMRLLLPSKPLVIECDQAAIHRVVNNLLSNALAATPRGGTITAQARCLDDEMEVSIQDTGVGLSITDLTRIFDKFVHVPGRTDGSGLGLAICRSIVEAHHGQVWAESAGLGKGARFVFRLPVKAPAIAPKGIRIRPLEARTPKEVQAP